MERRVLERHRGAGSGAEVLARSDQLMERSDTWWSGRLLERLRRYWCKGYVPRNGGPMLDLAQMRETIPLVQLCDSASRTVSLLDKGVQSPVQICVF